eukprot:8112825-Pyramimonas_sp.AAC.1
MGAWGESNSKRGQFNGAWGESNGAEGKSDSTRGSTVRRRCPGASALTSDCKTVSEDVQYAKGGEWSSVTVDSDIQYHQDAWGESNSTRGKSNSAGVNPPHIDSTLLRLGGKLFSKIPAKALPPNLVISRTLPGKTHTGTRNAHYYPVKYR